MCSRKSNRGAQAFCLCMIQPFIIWVFQNLGSGCGFRSPAFFSESAGKFCRMRSGTFFSLKEDPRMPTLTPKKTPQCRHIWHARRQVVFGTVSLCPTIGTGKCQPTVVFLRVFLQKLGPTFTKVTPGSPWCGWDVTLKHSWSMP